MENNECSPGTSTGSCEESGRGCRNKKRQVDPACCPVCSITLRENEVDMHLSTEIEKLNKLPSPKVRLNGGKTNPSSSNSNTTDTTDKNWETFKKVRSNRQTRQRVKTKKRKFEETCPICNKEVTEEIQIHVELCLRKSETNHSDDDDIDVENFDEYNWAGQSRIRTTSLLESGVSGLGTSVTMAEEDEDLVVDVDDSVKYGSPQYSETDVILPCDDPENDALRKAVTGTDPKRSCPSLDTSLVSENGGDPVLEVLKNRIKELESKSREELYKCLICMERYRTPVTSVCCWHVHCEECWLQTLGAKKLCPQCNMITSPSDLRKIYM